MNVPSNFLTSFPGSDSKSEHIFETKCTDWTFYSDIDEPVYFFDGENVVESYQFKQLKVTRTIGKMNETFNMQWIEESDIVKRRGNFQGQLLISLTG